MAKKKITRSTAKHAGTGHTCGECRIGTWDTKFINKSLTGIPIVKTCDFSTYARNVMGERVTLRSVPACEMFEPE